MSIPWYHRFLKIIDRFFAYEIDLHGEEQLVKNYQQVFPPVMPPNMGLIYRWVPPRKDPKTGQAIETHRIQFFLVPWGAKGPRPHEISRVLDENDVPKEIQQPEPLDIPDVIKRLKRPEECEVVAARMGIVLPGDADLKTVHVLLASAAVKNLKAKEVLKQMEETAEKPGARDSEQATV